jgi:hypothetical protein
LSISCLPDANESSASRYSAIALSMALF